MKIQLTCHIYEIFTKRLTLCLSSLNCCNDTIQRVATIPGLSQTLDVPWLNCTFPSRWDGPLSHPQYFLFLVCIFPLDQEYEYFNFEYETVAGGVTRFSYNPVKSPKD